MGTSGNLAQRPWLGLRGVVYIRSMYPIIRATPHRAPRLLALAACLAACLAPIGCGEADPLEAIRQQQQSGNYAGSIEPLRELLATRPDDPEVNFLYGRALALTQRSHLASWSLRKAMEDPQWLVPAGSQLALAALATRDFNEVVEITSRILEQEPDNARVLLMRASAHAHWRKDPELALADAQRVLEIDPDIVEAYEPRILALLSLGRIEEASESLAEAGQRLVELGASEGTLGWHCSTTATFQQESGDVEQARGTWAECLEAHPANLEVISGAMAFHDAQGEWERSIELLREAVAADPGSRNLRVTLAHRLRLHGDAGGAEALLREATSAEGPLLAAAAWMDLAKLRKAMGEHDAAADALQQAIELAREAGTPDPQLLFEYADTLVLARRFDRALEAAEELPVPAHRLMIRARVAQERRDPARALAEFDEALKLWPDNPWARYHAALAAEELGDFERALAEFRYAVRIAPAATDARTRGASLLLARGQPALALQMLVTGLGQSPLEMEGQLLSMRLMGFMGNMAGVSETLTKIEESHPAWAGRALAAAAEGVARRAGPTVALGVLMAAPGVDYADGRYAAALGALVRLSHEAGETAETQGTLERIFAEAPESAALHEIRGLDLELSGAAPEEVRAAYERALEIDPGSPEALAGLGRLAQGDDPEAAVALFDRAAAADPSDAAPKLEAARALLAAGRIDDAAERLDHLLLEHPFEAEAAAERARLDLDRGVATPQTLERARRAVVFGGGPDALDLLGRVHAQRGEDEPAARAAERAQALREARAARDERRD
jgi:tetratricopeptide (TPR) repeat protein